jgi:arylsulfatase A-like enzyme
MSSQSGDLPNILWIACHDINPDLGCYAGSWPSAEYAQTPNLDRLAEAGARYDQAFASAPVCSPSRSAVITGMYPTAIGPMHHRSRAVPPPEVRCFPEYLRAAGYYCTNNYSTDYNFTTPVTVWDESSPQAHWRSLPDSERPFFAVFHTAVTHQSQIYVDDEQYLRNTTALADEQRHDPAVAPLPPYYPDTPVMRQAWARYRDNVTALDYWAGDLLAQLDEDGLSGDTLVVFWSDHGRGMPRAKMWPYETGLHVPLIVRWPGKIAPGTVRRELVGLMDLGPAMLAVSGLPVPEQMHGQPLFNASGQFASTAREYVIGHRDRIDAAEDCIRTVRDTRYRYVRHYPPDRPYFGHHEDSREFSTVRELRHLEALESLIRQFGETPAVLTDAQRQFLAPSKPQEELYDLTVDPHEINNLATDPAHAAELQRLRTALERWQSTYSDLGLIPEAELIERSRPGGHHQTTAPPQLEVVDGEIIASCRTPGASIAWTADAPAPRSRPLPSAGEVAEFITAGGPPQLTDEEIHDLYAVLVGAPANDGRSWRLYCAPFVAPTETPIWFRACCLGYRDSPDVVLDLVSRTRVIVAGHDASRSDP